MKVTKPLFVSILLVLAAGVWLRSEAQTAGQNQFQSKRLQSLARDLDAGKSDSLGHFWEEVREHTPLIEPADDDPRFCWVTFVWQGSAETRKVDLLGDRASSDNRGMSRFRDTDLWFKTERIPADARFAYSLRENEGGFAPDPLNTRHLAGRSLVELSNAPPQSWIQQIDGIPKGTVVQKKFQSAILKEERPIAVYTPSRFTPQGDVYDLLIVFDGESYGYTSKSVVQTPTVLDNLLNQVRIPATVAIFVNSMSQEKRSRDLLCSIPFEDFLAKEIVPWAAEHYHTSDDPSRIVVAGSSYGGLSAACAALRHPEVFGNVLSQSGTFSWYPNWNLSTEDYAVESGWLTRQFVAAPKLPLRFYMEAGRFEGRQIYSLLAENRRLRDVLEAKGYQVTYREYSGGHDYATWRNSIGDGLIALIGDQRLR